MHILSLSSYILYSYIFYSSLFSSNDKYLREFGTLSNTVFDICLTSV